MWSLDTCMDVNRTNRPDLFYRWSSDTCMDINRQNEMPSFFNVWSLDTCINVHRRNKRLWLLNRHACRCIYNEKCTFWLVLCVHYTHMWMHAERPVRYGLCYACSPDSCMNVYSKKNTLWFVLHAFTRYFPAHRYTKPALLQHIMGHRAASGSQPCHLRPISNSIAILLIRMQNQAQIPRQLKDRVVLWMCDSV
jgi:hypothetical protein